MTEPSHVLEVPSRTHKARRLPAAVAVLLVALFATTLAPGTSQAWTNNSKAYNLIEIPSWGNVMATDGLGNSYIAVSVKDTFTIGSVTASVGTSWRYMILKTDRSGNAVWGTVVPDGPGDVMAMEADDAGNVYLAGQFENTTTIGATSLTSAGSTDIWVAKLNTSGTVVWVRSFGSNGSDWGNGVGVDGAGNVYVSGGMQGSVTFGSTTLTSAGNNDLFLTKLNTSGTVQWATRVGGTGDDNGGWLQGLAVDSAGNSFVSGQIQGTVTVAGSTLTSAGGLDAFVGKVNSSGVWQWGAIGGSTDSEHAYGVALDGQGGAYLTGLHRGASTFGSISIGHSGSEDAYVARVNSSGTWQWVRTIHGTGSDNAVSIDSDSTGAPVVAGYFYSPTMTVGSTTLTYAGGSHADAWAAKWNASGTFQWAVHLGGTYDDGFYGVAVDSDDNVRATGWAGKSNAVSFDGAAPISIMAGCTNDCWSYVEWKLSPTGGVPTTTTTTTAAPTTTVAATTTVPASTTSVAAAGGTTTVPAAVNPLTATTVAAAVTPGSTAVNRSTSASTVAPATGSAAAPAATTSTVPPTTTTVPVDTPDDTPVELGSLAASVDGKEVATTLRRESNNIVASAAGLTARYGATDASNNPVPLDADGNLRVMPGQTINLSVEGAAAGSTGEAWMFSDPVKLGSFEVADTGSAVASFRLPDGVESGNHTLLVSTRDSSDRVTELRLGFAVGEMPEGVSTAGIVVTLLVIAGLAAVLLPVALKRRRTA